METVGSKPESPAVAYSRLSSTFQTRVSPSKPFALSVRMCTSESDNKLCESRKTDSIVLVSRPTIVKEMHRGDVTTREGLLLPRFCRSEVFGRMETDYRLIRPECAFSSGVFHYGHPSEDKRCSDPWNVGYKPGFIRCLPSYSYSSSMSSLPLFSSGLSQISVPRSSFWPQSCSVGFHGSYGSGQEVGSLSRHATVPVHRRLVQYEHFPSYTCSFDPHVTNYMSGSGSSSKLREIRADAFPEYYFPGRETRLSPFNSLHYRRQGSQSSPFDSWCPLSTVPIFTSSRMSSGLISGHIPDCTVRSSSFETSSVSSYFVPSVRQGTFSHNHPFPAYSQSVGMVGEFGQFDERPIVSSPHSSGHSFHGRLSEGLGNRFPRQNFQGSLETCRSSHKLAGAQSSFDFSPNSAVSVKEQMRAVSNRQFHSSVLFDQTRGHEIEKSVETYLAHLGASPFVEHLDYSQAHYRASECFGGLGFPIGPSYSFGMASVPSCVSMGDSQVSVGPSSNRLVCQSVESTVGLLCLPLSGSGRVGNRRSSLSVPITSNSLRLPASLSGEEVSDEVAPNTAVSSVTSSAHVSVGSVASITEQSQSGVPDPSSLLQGVGQATSLGSLNRTPSLPELTSIVFGEKRLLECGYSARVVKRLISSHSVHTRKQYMSKWTLFVSWASKKSPPYDVTNPSLVVLAEFFEYLFHDRGIQAGSISNYKSAIQFFWKRMCNYDIPQDDLVLKNLLLSFKRERPIPPRVVVQWDLRLVLDFFSSDRFGVWDAVSDKDLTLKTVFLLALASGKRCSELHALTREVKFVQGEKSGVTLVPHLSFVSKTQLKTSNLGALKSIFIPDLITSGVSDRSECILCPVTCLRYYLARSDKYRGSDQKRLIISWVKGNSKDVVKMTVAHYIKQAIQLAYKEASPQLLSSLKLNAHSVRHVSTSLCALRNFSLEQVVEAGSWVSPNVFISNYIQNFSEDSLSGLKSLGGGVCGCWASHWLILFSCCSFKKHKKQQPQPQKSQKKAKKGSGRASH